MTVQLDAFRCRGLADANLDAPPVETFKVDQRSRVWRVDTSKGPVVVKRFEFVPMRQKISTLIGRHPAQLELLSNRRLHNAKVRVVPIMDGGVESKGMGCWVWLATPLAGTSLQRLLTGRNAHEQPSDQSIDAAARLTVDLIRAGFWFKDLKPSNIVIDEKGEAHLIDVGSARPSRDRVKVDRMLRIMQRVLSRDGVDQALRDRFGSTVRQAVGKR